jgi:DNA adenine methylase
MFFYLGPKSAEISDFSAPLVETYRAVKRDPEAVLKFLGNMKPTKANFDRIKRMEPGNSDGWAGRFIFLNKACWNGLYRVNSKGEFNVPYGQPRTDFVIDRENFRRCATQLRRRNVRIECQDFGEIEPRVSRGDFVFFDPPYVTSHNLNGFVDWNEQLFRWNDQIRLAELAARLARRGANVLVTNAHHPDVEKLYATFKRRSFERSSTLASDSSRRVQTAEAIFFSGPAYTDFSVRTHGHVAKSRQRRVGESVNHPKERA